MQLLPCARVQLPHYVRLANRFRDRDSSSVGIQNHPTVCECRNSFVVKLQTVVKTTRIAFVRDSHAYGDTLRIFFIRQTTILFALFSSSHYLVFSVATYSRPFALESGGNLFNESIELSPRLYNRYSCQ